MESKDLIALVAAVLALAFSAVQWVQSQQQNRLKLLLGEKETAGYQALQIASHPRRRVSKDTIRALILVTIFEPSDRARIQVYQALDALKPRYEHEMIDMRTKIVEAADNYGHAADLGSFEKRRGQLDRAIPWITGPEPDSPAPT